MRKIIRFVGMDVHKDSITVAVALPGNQPARLVGTIATNFSAVLDCLEKIGPTHALRVCYEAGSCGYGLARFLLAHGVCCIVVAPSLIPQTPGCRIKTDKRDAIKLAQCLRNGELTAVAIPDLETEAMRDLVRARRDAKRAELAARQQLNHFLQRHERIWSKPTRWTAPHLAWIAQQQFACEAQRRVLGDYLSTVQRATVRVEELSKDIEELVEQWEPRPLVIALQALRGVRVVTATTLVAELGDFARFHQARDLMAFVGLVPSEDSSGPRRRRGAITGAGNAEVRRVLVEAAWHYQHRPAESKELQARLSKVSPSVREIAWKAQKRLHRRFTALLSRKMMPQKAATAVARELLGFVWAIVQECAAGRALAG